MAITAADLCTIILKKLGEVANRSSKVINHDQGLLALTLSGQNRDVMGFEANTIDTRDGKPHKMVVRYIQPDSVADYSAPITDTFCEPTTPDGFKYKEVEVEEVFASKPFTFSYSDIRKFCETKDASVAEFLNTKFSAIRSGLNQAIWAKVIAGGYIGNFAYGGAAGKTIPLFKTTESAINPVGELTVNRDMTLASLNGYRPIWVGANMLQDYATMKKIACCNTNGFNSGLLDAFEGGYVLDTSFDTQEGSGNNMLLLLPGALQFLSLNHNAGDFKAERDTYKYTTMPDPLFPNLIYDMYVRESICLPGEEYNIKFTIQFLVRWDLWGLPTDAFKVGDPLEGVTNIFHYIGECNDNTVCEIPVS